MKKSLNAEGIFYLVGIKGTVHKIYNITFKFRNLGPDYLSVRLSDNSVSSLTAMTFMLMLCIIALQTVPLNNSALYFG